MELLYDKAVYFEIVYVPTMSLVNNGTNFKNIIFIVGGKKGINLENSDGSID